MKIISFTIIILLLVGYTSLFSQEISLHTYGVSPRDVARDSIQMYFDRAYNGLMNVGNETKVFLKGESEEALSNPTWNFLARPNGSNAAFGQTYDLDTNIQIITFIPDLVGTYKVEFMEGISGDTITINSAEYFGVEGGVISCIGCHNTAEWDYKYDEWLQTGHATMLERGLNGTLSNHYGEGCIGCHTVGYDVDADNNGFDDFPFIFPDSLYPGVYNQMLSMYPDAMGRANIQCESCHGPGSEHYGIKSNSRIVKQLDADNCAWCHDSGDHHVFPEQWDHSGDDATEFDGRGFEGGHAKGTYIERGNNASCAPCHSGSGHVEWIEEGRPVNEFGLPAGITDVPEVTKHTCAVCHDPHDAENEHQLRFEDTQLGDGTPITMELYGPGATCMQCHRARRNAPTYSEDPNNASSHYGPHHGPQADLLLASNTPIFKDENGNTIQFPTSPHAVAILPGEEEPHACVNCHMGGEDKVDSDGNVILVGGHSWNMNDAEGNDFVEACAPCHGNVGNSFKEKKYYLNGFADHDGDGVEEGVQLEVQGLMEQLALLLPPVGENEVTLENGDSTLTPSIMKSAYVYVWVEEDRSFGIHNPAFAVALLKAAIVGVGGTVVYAPELDSGIPSEYSLEQNYPNPFNPSTTIEFTVPQESNVKVVVFDVLGKEIATLVNEEKPAGTYELTWNAANLPSGVYFYRIHAGEFVETKKMVLMK